MKAWTNKELDGTIFLIGMVITFLLINILSFLSPEYAQLSVTEKAFDIIETMFVFMAGFLFKKAVDSIAREDSRDKRNTPS